MEPLSLVDQHSHGVIQGPLGLGSFERHLALAHGGAGSAGFLDSRAGLALRRWCPPLLGLEPGASAVRYLARRRELGAYASVRMLLRGSGIRALLVQRGPAFGADPGEELTSPRELGAAAGARAAELVGLERLAAEQAASAASVPAFLRGTAEALHAAARTAAAFVCDAARLPPGCGGPPEAGAVRLAAGRWLAGGARTGHPVLTGHLLWGALATGRPVQLRGGDPGALAGVLQATAGRGRLVLLPDPPHHRAAARMAARFTHVYADAGPDPAGALGEAPFGRLLFSSRAGALPELHVVRARQFRAALDRALGAWIADGECDRAQAVRIAARVASGTARELYGLDEAV